MSTTMDAPPRTAAFSPEQAPMLGTGTRTPGWDLAVERRADDGQTLANFLGWFSLGLGAAELLAPRALEEWLGVEGRKALVQGYGVREIGTGIGILTERRPAGWVWGRVAGDVLDLGTLATALTPDNPRKRNVLLAMGAVAGVMALDVLCARQLSRRYAE
ncbi:hypothetical protein [Longimicrobium sp.]|uniref:hypothetical protein n=1 Tax=Longimicrobium sp. TaxID=2029185 RepID=UPI002E35D8DB|nr:hypothetical protein [Longimicrobium sp.]HEX6040606.1 hypothetical protein [Longimicrobium sp.]